MGSLEVLNAGSGHLTVTFDKSDTIELARALRMIQDMLTRGYAIFVYDESGVLVPVKRFDAEKDQYVLGDVPADVSTRDVGELSRETLVQLTAEPALCRCGKPSHHPGRCRKIAPVTKPLAETKAIAVGRTAGG